MNAMHSLNHPSKSMQNAKEDCADRTKEPEHGPAKKPGHDGDHGTGHDHVGHDHAGNGSAAPYPVEPVAFERMVVGNDAGGMLTAPLLFRANLGTLNQSGVTGFAEFARDGDRLTARVEAEGLEPGQVHIQHIHGRVAEDGSSLDSYSPTPGADADGDGFVELAEGLPSYGPILLNLTNPPGGGLDAFPTAPDGQIRYEQTFDLSDQGVLPDGFTSDNLLPLNFREVVIHGLSVDGFAGAGTSGEVDGTSGYKLVLPVAAGPIAAVGVQMVAGNGDSTLIGAGGDDSISGGSGNDEIRSGDGDDLIFSGKGADLIFSGDDVDVIDGGSDNDTILGGRNNDIIRGGDGDDLLHGDGGLETQQGTDLSADIINGGLGDDILWTGDGLNVLTGGSGNDTFTFKFSAPVTPLAAGTGPAFTEITDFRNGDNRLAFDVPGLGKNSVGASFVDNGDGTAGSATTSFFSGAAVDARGENVVVVTDQAFTSGAQVAPLVAGEQAGDFLIYFNSTVGVASLLHVSAPDTAASIARFTDIESLEDLQNTAFTANDFVFV
jgi:hypothetical protein